ncbi:hypothetical protein CLOSTMETH_00750 [[Clostridium] methylpentosum DSM 5476]|uniref:Uncharacterized protein n=1 Tax=[Clostridium] methylpentosum DSM 5476 TaxID=537013 RepID=C0EA96_9FIRM|nr:hypothetical protein CLOSTMETH_00750 [[Clostridium] methylpentosum DSM 5476]
MEIIDLAKSRRGISLSQRNWRPNRRNIQILPERMVNQYGQDARV